MFGRNLPVRRGVPSNPGHIAATKECLRELSQIGTNLCIGGLHQTISAKFQDLGAYLAQNQNNFSLEVIWNSISFAKAADIRTEMEQTCVEIMELILAIYSTEFVPMIFDSVPEAVGLKSRFTLTEAYTAQESSNGQNALRRNLSPIYSELNELARVQEQLISSFPQVQAMVGDGSTDWGDTALNFGAGALAVANPLIGVPFLIARICGGSKKDEANNMFMQHWGVRLDEYWNRWNRVYNGYQPVFESQCRFVEEKMRDISERAIPNLLAELDAQGFNLKRVPATYQVFLKDIKQKYGITE